MSKDSKKFTSVSIIVFSLSLTGAMVFMTYSGCLTSILATQNYVPPYTSLKEMKNKDNFKLLLLSGASAQSAILSFAREDPAIKKVYENSIKPYEFSVTSMESRIKEFSESADEFSALLANEDTINIFSERCN